MHDKYRNFVLWSPILVIVGLVGCPAFKQDEPAPNVALVPSQEASTGVETRFDLAPFVSGVSLENLTWDVVSGEGSIEGTEYVNTFTVMGSYKVAFRVSNGSDNSTDSEFTVVVQSEFMAVVQRGNDLDLLDGATGALYPIASGGPSPLAFRQRLPNGWLVFERMGGSSVDLFVHNLNEAYQLGGAPGLNTVYDNHALDGRVFFEEGSASETGLYMWNPDSGSKTTIAWRAGMHNRNAFINSAGVVYFEFGNNGQSDIYLWRPEEPWGATVFSSDYHETIRTMMPDGGIVFSTKGLVGEDELFYFRRGHGPFTICGDLPGPIQNHDMRYVTHTSQSLVVVESEGGSKDLWMWSPLGLNSKAIANSSADECFESLTPGEQVVYRTETAPGNNDLRVYHYTTDSTRDIGTSLDNEVFEAVLPNSDVVFAVESSLGRELYRFDVVSGQTELIAGGVGESYSLAAVLGNGQVVYHQGGVAGGTMLWNPSNGKSAVVAGPGSQFGGDCGDGDFVVSVPVNGQMDLSYWDQSQGKLIVVAQTAQDEKFQAAFYGGVVIYSAVVAPKTSADLFRWSAGTVTRISNGGVDYSVVAVVRGAL